MKFDTLYCRLTGFINVLSRVWNYASTLLRSHEIHHEFTWMSNAVTVLSRRGNVRISAHWTDVPSPRTSDLVHSSFMSKSSQRMKWINVWGNLTHVMNSVSHSLIVTRFMVWFQRSIRDLHQLTLMLISAALFALGFQKGWFTLRARIAEGKEYSCYELWHFRWNQKRKTDQKSESGHGVMILCYCALW